MALPLLVNGAECGPSNPLQGLTKQFDKDRGLQQDQFIAGRAGSSKETFRSQYTPSPGLNQDANRFFSDSATHTPPLTVAGPSAYDLAALHNTLPPIQPAFAPAPSPVHSQLSAPIPSAAPWAADFLQHQQMQPQFVGPVAATTPDVQYERQQGTLVQSPSALSALHRPQQGVMQWANGPMAIRPFGPIHQLPEMTQFQQQRESQSAAIEWDKEFRSHEVSLSSEAEPIEQALHESQTTSPSHVHDADELARTAGLLVESVRNEENPKFKNSQFLSLMRQLRDREMVVEGNQVVKSTEQNGSSSTAHQGTSWSTDFQASVDVKGKGRAMEPIITAQPVQRAANGTFQQTMPVSWASIARETLDKQRAEEQHGVSEDPVDAYFRQDNEDYIKYWDGSFPSLVDSVKGGASSTSHGVNQVAEWDKLQRDWDIFEATTTGIRTVSSYQFQPNNPYLLGEASRTRHHAMHSQEIGSMNESVLELEAAVQRDPMNSLAWYELGVKQQENEREQKAVHALRRALELDPTHLPSWIALAISHTNEGNRQGTYQAIREWVDRNDHYRDAVHVFRALNRSDEDRTQSEKFQELAQCLMAMARSDTSGNIDPDIQVALAVLLNTSEDYDKARDCFLTALAVRPEDWLLYNRVGATLANSGHPEEALQYYYRALELNPSYIRARFNLGISCINLRRYDEAAGHILDALVLQDSDTVVSAGDSPDDKRGITSSVLWDSLKTCCMHMQRLDLATLCDRQDLETFRFNFNLA